jgi:ABC-type nitrate/sulfonate/bicarbonate transport system substrate-binding protein
VANFPKKKAKHFALIFIVIIIITAAVLSSFFYLYSQNSHAGNFDNISFGTFFGSSEPYPALVYIAQDQRFFAQNGINLTIRDYASATSALNAALSNQVNLVMSSEYAFVATNVLGQGNLNIIATIDKAQSVSIVGRKDRGIETIANLEGKKIGLTFQIAPQFYLARFLELNNIDLQNVNQINVPTTEYVSAIVNGSVDAVVVSDSSISQIENQLPNDTVVWSVQSSQLLDMVVSAKSDWILQHPDLTTRFLKSLSEAEDYSVNHLSGAQAIVQKQLNINKSVMAEKWASHEFSLSLDQSLVLTMQDEARWMISSNLTNATGIPNFLNYIYVKGLETARSSAVNVLT